MPIRYVGVFCQRGHFIVLSTHRVTNPNVYGSDVRDSGTVSCPTCGVSTPYTEVDIAHSDSPEGKHPKYPNRTQSESH
jgi:hypothetical protein